MILDIEKIKDKIKSLKEITYSETTLFDKITPAAVLIPLFEIDGETNILFTKRSDKVSHHKGQISFPGGKVDQTDKDLMETALRETFEEIGIKNKDVDVLGKINNMVTNTGFLVTPFVGVINQPYEININSYEIDELIYVPISHLLNKNNFRVDQREFGGHSVTIYYYDYNQYTIWGVTGKILFDFLNLID